MLFPSTSIASRCVKFLKTAALSIAAASNGPDLGDWDLSVLDLVFHDLDDTTKDLSKAITALAAVLFPKPMSRAASKFWQHTGEGISSRRAEFCQHALTEGRLHLRPSVSNNRETPRIASKGPKRYQRLPDESLESQARAEISSADEKLNADKLDTARFVEERFGRNLNVSQAENAKLAIRRRIAGKLEAKIESVEAPHERGEEEPQSGDRGVSEDDVYLFPTGMSSIFNSHRMLMEARGPLKSIMFG